jgi:hypothetical protein
MKNKISFETETYVCMSDIFVLFPYLVITPISKIYVNIRLHLPSVFIYKFPK